MKLFSKKSLGGKFLCMFCVRPCDDAPPSDTLKLSPPLIFAGLFPPCRDCRPYSAAAAAAAADCMGANDGARKYGNRIQLFF